MTMRARPQPRPGDVLLGCVHRPDPYAAHIYSVPDGLGFRRPDGSTETAKWIVLCDGCHQRYVILRGGSASDAPLARDFTWTDKREPIQYKEPS